MLSMSKYPYNVQVNFEKLTLYKNKNKAFEQSINYKQTIPMVGNELVGIEIEAENIEECPVLFNYWVIKEDGSLRNFGKEFVSQPLEGRQVENALNVLRNTIGHYADFSPRTSVHVHLNMQKHSQEQLYILVILYAIFEKHFFHIADKKRESSLFCVPIYQTNLLRYLNECIIHEDTGRWHKYAAINILPMISSKNRYGTVEFRHLEGTLDINKIILFINSMYCLQNYCSKWHLDELISFIKSANSTSGYIHLYKTIFGEYCQSITNSDIEYCISQVKKQLFVNTYKETIDVAYKRASQNNYLKSATVNEE